MKNAQEASGRVRIGKRHPATTYSQAIKIKRFLNAFKGGYFAGQGGEILTFTGDPENA
jgi:hypothetical protein